MKKHNKLKIILTCLFPCFCTIFLLIAFNVSNSPSPFGWNQQWLPNMGGRHIVDITFTDSLHGYGITNRLSLTDTSFILMTSNGGDNWSFVFGETTTYSSFKKLQFINQNTGYVAGFITDASYNYHILKTVNGGLNWFYIKAPYDYGISDMAVLNEDTIWVSGCNGFYDAIMRTTDGGTSWQEMFSWGSLQDTYVYMYNSRIGFACLSFPASLWKTTNSGLNWFNIANKTFTYMYFIDSLNGWKSTGAMEKTSDGGYNWVTQVMPSGGYIFSNQLLKFANINKDTLWGVGGYIQFPPYPPLKLRGIIYKTINGGLNWGFQLPDTHTVTCTAYGYVNFTDKNIGWAYNGYTGVHTVTGGDTVTYIGIQQISESIPMSFELRQNYPNPFNPRTRIPYSLRSPAYVRITAYDILGRQVQTMVDQYQKGGEYEVDFIGKFSASGVYFYRMQVMDDKGNTIFSNTKKMILLK